jgi:hypothetical protein
MHWDLMKNRKIVMQNGVKDLQFIPIAVWTKSLKAFLRARLQATITAYIRS